MRRALIIGFALSLLVGSTRAQQRPIQSLYMFDPLVLNPAYAGTQVQLSATAIYRNQWVNLEGAPKTFTTTIHSGFLKSKMGLGLILGSDQIGVHSDLSVYGVYSYKIQLSRDMSLSMGIQGGFNYLESDYNKLNLKNIGDPNLTGTTSKYNPNVGAGVFLRKKRVYVGLSVPYLIENNVVDISANTLAVQQRYYYLMAGTSRDISANVMFMPSVLIRYQENAPMSFDVNGTFVFYKVVGLGVSYRLNDGIVGLFELQITDSFHMGYAYDFTTSDLNRVSLGSHEIMINYRLRIPKIHKGLECPAYW
ncbi:MAG: type IX secretion system membrane protein PorP/SprF [Cyclobacteriaceae bacterium]|nr:type IX secretion system membrane protein PorP/SprF [Cyclobacteriaceae bacterium]